MPGRPNTTIYKLYTDTESYIFMSEKEACEFIGAREGTVSHAYHEKIRAYGYYVEKIGRSSHGQSRSRLYRIWSGMYHRCYNEKRKDYKRYGGSGIKIYDKWLGKSGFINFAKWANSNGYTDELTIDRIDSKGNYEPSNCRWISKKEQCSNKGSNHWITINGENMTVTQAAEKYGIKCSTLRRRLKESRDLLTGKKMED